jgi:hypothetical protein
MVSKQEVVIKNLGAFMQGLPAWPAAPSSATATSPSSSTPR